ncbi:RING finger protein [Coprinopsis cinerea okayama7|uniref:RING finger protein n=1 Tax=Coprinopsis cinerea (strain Okayama-7 / 130 / ATCC MYA-4618 / FGSC 9003) TaxID=240176 RepID=A8N8C1_COPC7|nr:RING finger protein [Coprinopsis cinerea okayama7\|eukprot:XP_001831077.2 RING finger protein [Coprinopsis cinerea okayama7\
MTSPRTTTGDLQTGGYASRRESSSVICQSFRDYGHCELGKDCPKQHILLVASGKAVSASPHNRDENDGASEPIPPLPVSSTPRVDVTQIAAIKAISDAAAHHGPRSNVDVRKNPCFRWEKGSCLRGDQCRYRHDPEFTGLNTQGTAEKKADAKVWSEEDQKKFEQTALNVREKLRALASRGKDPNRDVGPSTPGTSREETHMVGYREPITPTDLRKLSAAARKRHVKASKEEKGGILSLLVRDVEATGLVQVAAPKRQREEVELQTELDRVKQEMMAELEFRQAIEESEKLLIAKAVGTKRQRDQEEKKTRRRKEEERERARKAIEEAAKRRREEEERIAEEKRMKEKELEEQRKRALEEHQKREAESTLSRVVAGSNLVTFSAGLQIMEVIPGFELCTVTLHDLPPDTKEEEIVRIFTEHLGIDNLTFHLASLKPIPGQKKVATLFLRSEQASLLPFAFEDIELREHPIRVEVGANATWGRMNAYSNATTITTLTIAWNLPSLTMIATCSSMEEAQLKVHEINAKPPLLGTRKVRAAMNRQPAGHAARYWTPASIKLTNIPCQLSTSDIAEFTGIPSIRQIKSPTYDLESEKQRLEARLAAYQPVKDSFETSENPNGLQAKIKFESYEDAEKVYDAIQQGHFGSFPHFRPSLPKRHEYSITIPVAQYEAQRSRWDELADSNGDKKKAFVTVKTVANGARMVVKVLGSDQEEVGVLKVRVEALVAGQRLDSNHWHSSFFSSDGSKFLERVNADTKAYIVLDPKLHALRAYGDDASLTLARGLISGEVERLNASEWSEKLPRRAVGFFMREGLKVLKDNIGEENATLDLATGTVKIKGGDNDRQLLRKLIREATLSGGGAQSPVSDNEKLCPICYNAASAQPFICGHSYCHGCLQHYLVSALNSDKFPLVCMGDEDTCKTPIPIPVILRNLPRESFNRLVEVAFQSYIHQHPLEYKYCPTPDCTQIYRQQGEGTTPTHQCPSCFVKICGTCNEGAHDGMNCEEARVHRDPKLQEQLNDEWLRDNGVKKCPGCGALVFKESGCNHMTCSKVTAV